jgi:hypothetical protein
MHDASMTHIQDAGLEQLRHAVAGRRSGRKSQATGPPLPTLRVMAEPGPVVCIFHAEQLEMLV